MPWHFPPWISWHGEVLAFISVGLAAGIAVFQQIKNSAGVRIAVPLAVLPFVGLALAAAIQAATGLITFAGDALIFWFYLVLCVTALMLGFAYGSDLKDVASRLQGRVALDIFAFTLLAGAMASCIIALVQLLNVWEGASWISRMPQLRRPGANLAQPNHLATLLLMGVTSLVYLYELRRLSAWTASLGFFVLSLGLAATESRTGVLSFMSLSAWYFVGRARVSLRLPPRAVGAAVIAFLCLFWAWPSLMSVLQNFPPDAEVNIRAGLRVIVWPQLLDALAMRPWWGWGLGEVSKAHNAVVHAYPVSDPFTYSHNILLDLALGVGLPMAAVLVLVVGGWLWRRVRSVQSLLTWYCLAAALPFAVHSMLEFPFAYAFFLAPVMFLLGVLEAASGARPVLRLGVWPVAAGLLLVTAIGAWSVVEYLEIEEDFRVARFEALRVGETPASYERPKVYLLTQLDAMVHGVRLVPKPAMTIDELQLTKKLAFRFPWPSTQNRYALSLALNGDPNQALRQMLVIRAMHGERTYARIKLYWETLAKDKYPQLSQLKLP